MMFWFCCRNFFMLFMKGHGYSAHIPALGTNSIWNPRGSMYWCCRIGRSFWLFHRYISRKDCDNDILFLHVIFEISVQLLDMQRVYFSRETGCIPIGPFPPKCFFTDVSFRCSFGRRCLSGSRRCFGTGSFASIPASLCFIFEQYLVAS